MTTELTPGQLYFIVDESILQTIWLKYSTHAKISIKDLSLPITLLFIGNKPWMGCCSDKTVPSKYCICNQEFLCGDKTIFLKKIFVKKTYERVQYHSSKTGEEQGIDFKEVRMIQYLASMLKTQL